MVKTVYLDNSHGPFRANVDYAVEIAARREQFGKFPLDGKGAFETRFGLEQVDRGICGGTGQRVGHERRAVHQRVGWIVGKKRVEDFVRCDGRCKAESSAGQRFSDAKNVRHDVGLFARKHCPGPT